MYHPSQLEKRFGGEAETPTNFWPPKIGREFNYESDRQNMNYIKEENYEAHLEENPLIFKHPEYIKDSSGNSRDFMFQSAEADATATDVLSNADAANQASNR